MLYVGARLDAVEALAADLAAQALLFDIQDSRDRMAAFLQRKIQ
jgi:hypothetical protein